MRAGTGVSPHMRDQFIWNKLSPRSPSRRETGTTGSSAIGSPCGREYIADLRGSRVERVYALHSGRALNLFSGCTFRSIVSIGGRPGLLNEDRNEHILLRHTARPACS